MSIKREDLDARRINFSDFTSGKRLPLIHPGELLRDDFLVPMKISIYTARARGRQSISPVGQNAVMHNTAFSTTW